MVMLMIMTTMITMMMRKPQLHVLGCRTFRLIGRCKGPARDKWGRIDETKILTNRSRINNNNDTHYRKYKRQTSVIIMEVCWSDLKVGQSVSDRDAGAFLTSAIKVLCALALLVDASNIVRWFWYQRLNAPECCCSKLSLGGGGDGVLCAMLLLTFSLIYHFNGKIHPMTLSVACHTCHRRYIRRWGEYDVCCGFRRIHGKP